MKNLVKHGGLWLLVAGLSLVMVSDVHAWPFRRRYRSNNSGNYSYRTNYRGYNTGMTVPSATVTAPGGGVNAGPTGANVNAPGVGTDANLRIRGQSPDGATPAP